MTSRRITAVALVSALASTAPAAGVPDLDGAVVALNILPPGQGQHLSAVDVARGGGAQPDHNGDQLAMYESLIRGAAGLTDSNLNAYFKDAGFGVEPTDIARLYHPRPDVTIVRDRGFNVPRVYGTTRAGTMYGAGYVSAEDRLFMMDVLRHVARGRLSELLGATEANLASDRAQRLVADYTEDELQAMADRLLSLDPELGGIAKGDLTAFVDGVNAYIGEATLDPSKLPAEYPALQIVPQPWRLTDSVALATLIGGQFSVGGGGQLRNERFLRALEKKHGPAKARSIFEDFRAANDPEAPVNVSQPFPFNADLPAPDPAAVARPDNSEVFAQALSASRLPTVVDGPFGAIRLGARGASNALLVSPELSATGRSLAVFGPQVGYYAPQILMEIELHGPGIHARGAAFPGISLYVLLGRGTRYAWSATTAFGDHIDIRAERLCEPEGTPTPSSTHYLKEGACIPMYVRTDTWLAKPTAGGVAPPQVVSMTTERTHRGIVVARGNVGGAPVAFVRERSSYGREVDATLTYVALHDPARITDLRSMQRAFDWFTFSFNWFLVNGDEIGFYTTGLYPKLRPGVDPDLPYWGDTTWDPVEHLTFEEHPQAINPPSGSITNWNNKQAPGFRAPDDMWSYGSVQRKQLLEDGVAAARADDGKVSMVELVKAMADAATRDLRGAHVLPYALDALGTPSDSRLAGAAALLREWASAGAHRRDLDGDGAYDHASAVALMDALWLPLLQEVFLPALGEEAFAALPTVVDEPPGARGSSYLKGLYGQLQKDLRSTLGLPVASAHANAYCGPLDACRDAIARALDRALTDLEGRYGADPAAWDADEGRDRIQFQSVGVFGQPSMAWQNRPTFQQVLEFE